MAVHNERGFNLVIAILLGMAALFGFAYFDRYYRWCDCFNDLGRCYDVQTALESGCYKGRIFSFVIRFACRSRTSKRNPWKENTCPSDGIICAS